MGWQEELLERFREEKERFEGPVIEYHKEIIQLKKQNARLKHENETLMALAPSKSTHENDQQLVQENSRLKSECIDLFRQNQKEKADLQAAKKDLQVANEAIQHLQKELSTLKSTLDEHKNICKELKEHKIKLQDELNASRLTNDSQLVQLDVKTKEYQQLLTQFLELKTKEADFHNHNVEKANEKMKQDVARRLSEAVKTMPSLPDGGDNTSAPESLPSYSLSLLPTRLLQFINPCCDGEISSVCFAPLTGKFIASGGADNLVTVWKLNNNQLVKQHSLRGASSAIRSIHMTEENEKVLLASSNLDFAIRMWNLNTQQVVNTSVSHTGAVNSVKFLNPSGGNNFFSGGADRTVRFWDVTKTGCIQTFLSQSVCYDVTSCGSAILMSGHFDKRVRFWDHRSGTDIIQELQLSGKVTSLDMCSDNVTMLASWRDPNDSAVAIIDTRKYAVVHELSTVDGFKLGSDMTRACFSPDGQYVSVGTSDGGVLLWNVLTRKLLSELKEKGGHSSPVVSCSWQRTSQSLFVSVEKNKGIALWGS